MRREVIRGISSSAVRPIKRNEFGAVGGIFSSDPWRYHLTIPTRRYSDPRCCHAGCISNFCVRLNSALYFGFIEVLLIRLKLLVVNFIDRINLSSINDSI